MDDMQAIEQRITRELVRRAGPSEPVDDAAIFTAITATQSPKWRFQPMFSAARFVFAGVIVALFGGFLLAGLLTQPSDDMAPAAVTASPSPTTTEDLLSGMTTEEVEPGIHQVLSDGGGHDLVADPPVGLTVAPDGSVWLLRGARPPDTGNDPDWATDPPAYADAVYRLGQEGTFPFESGITSNPSFADLAVGRDGTAWTTVGAGWPGQASLGSFDGSAWSYPAWPDGSTGVAAFETTQDGTVWVTQEVEDGPGPRVARIVNGAWTELPTLEDPSLAGYFHGMPKYFAAAPDGTAWLANGDFHLGGMAPAPAGLLHFDGTRWEVVELPPDKSWNAGPLALGPDGTLWVHLMEDTGCCIPYNSQQPYLARLDDDGWQLFGTDVPRMIITSGFEAPMAVDADGTLWTGTTRGVVAFDGDTWTHYLDGVRDVSDIGLAPDGSVLALTYHESGPGLYVITPQAVGATGPVPAEPAPEFLETDALLPGVELVTEEVEPGVYRVVSDGVRELAGSAWDRFHANVVAGFDGSVWILDEDDFYRIGDPETHPATVQTRLAPADGPRAYVDPDGSLWAMPNRWDEDGMLRTESGLLWSLTDGEWRLRREQVETFAVQPDGTVWAVRDVGPPDEPITLERLDADGWTIFTGPELDPGGWNQLLVGPGTHPSNDIDDVPEDVVDYFLNRGADYPSEEVGGFAGNTALGSWVDGIHADVGAGGDTWVYMEAETPVAGPDLRTQSVPYLVQGRIDIPESVDNPSGGDVQAFTGVTATYGPESSVLQAASMGYGMETVMRTGPDGRVWMIPQAPGRTADGSVCDGVASFDGQRWTRHLQGLCIHALDVSLDGAAWVRARADEDREAPVHTYVITPEAVAGTE